MRGREFSLGMIVAFCLAFVCLPILHCGCASKSEDADKVPRYSDKVDVEVTLGPSADLWDLEEDDLFYSVTNRGDRTIIQLSGELVFHDTSGEEVARTGFMLLSASPNMEAIAAEGKKARWRPLAAGQTMNDSYDVVYLFAGESELRERIVPEWDNLTVRPVIREIVTE